MDPNDISPYLVHLAKKYQDLPPEELATIIRQEAMPELIAQFVESDGTFKGFVEQSGLLTADLLDGFETMDDQAKEAFFAVNPKLENRFHIFVSLRDALRDEGLMTKITSDTFDDYKEGFFDEGAVVAWMEEEPPELPVEKIKKNPPPKKPGWFDWFWLFRNDNPTVNKR